LNYAAYLVPESVLGAIGFRVYDGSRIHRVPVRNAWYIRYVWYSSAPTSYHDRIEIFHHLKPGQ
jgi:hypothetical protein